MTLKGLSEYINNKYFNKLNKKLIKKTYKYKNIFVVELYYGKIIQYRDEDLLKLDLIKRFNLKEFQNNNSYSDSSELIKKFARVIKNINIDNPYLEDMFKSLFLEGITKYKMSFNSLDILKNSVIDIVELAIKHKENANITIRLVKDAFSKSIVSI